MTGRSKSVVVLYNQVEENEYEWLRRVDPATLGFTPCYDIHVATPKEEYDAIVNALRREGFRARGVNLNESLSKLHSISVRNPPDAVFNLVESFRDDPRLESAVAGYLDLFRIPYTGASPFSLTLCRRKGFAKQILLQNGVATPDFRLLDSPMIGKRHGLRYPLMVKPARQDASSGVDPNSVVRNYAELTAQLDRVFAAFRGPILVEEFIAGKELHVSVLGNTPAQVLPIVEFDFSALPSDHPPLITYDVKWNPLALAYHRVHTRCPAQLEARTEKLVKKQALQAYQATCCRDYARLDIRLGLDGVPHVLEVNPNPDLTEGVSFMESAEKAGLSFSQTLHRIVDFALERGGKAGK
jgi:D-alanine-D-alanine ligase